MTIEYKDNKFGNMHPSCFKKRKAILIKKYKYFTLFELFGAEKKYKKCFLNSEIGSAVIIGK